jgi:hypothetical protein
MKIRLNFVICAVLLIFLFGISHEATSASPAKKLTQAQKEFLLQCGIEQKDIDIIPLIRQQTQNRLVEAAETKDCSDEDIVLFKAARKYVKLYYPPPEDWVKFDEDWDSAFLTPAEREHILACDKALFNRKQRNRNN